MVSISEPPPVCPCGLAVSFAVALVEHCFLYNVHLLKNIRNNLLNNRKFVFLSFSFSVGQTSIGCGGGYIAWADLNTVNEKEQSLSANLKKAHSLSCKALNSFITSKVFLLLWQYFLIQP